MHTIRYDGVSQELLSDIVARDCVLWLTASAISDKNIDQMVSLTDAPWRAVLVESTDARFAGTLAARSQSLSSLDSSGAFTHLIASDPSALQLQRRAKPLFFLNGRSDRSGTESNALPRRSADRRRLNMTARLRELEPRRVIVVGANNDSAIEDLLSLWETEFRSLLSFVTDDIGFQKQCDGQLSEFAGLNVLQWIVKPAEEFAAALLSRLEEVARPSALTVSVQVTGGTKLEVDLAKAELAEQPISDMCEFVLVRDTLPVSAEDLREPEIHGFFTRGVQSWRPFAAGLPWVSDSKAERSLLAALHDQLAEGGASVQVLSIISEPGAGGTTQARVLALAAARAGFPTLLIKQESSMPSPLELTGFLFRSTQEVLHLAAASGLADCGEPVWLLVLDVQHGGRSSDELERLCSELIRSGRKVAILKVALDSFPPELPESIPLRELMSVAHELSEDDVQHLGHHLNRFLRLHDKQKSPAEWVGFWTQHRPDIGHGVASFWIALEFWLAGFLALGESIQGWVTKQFKELSGPPDVQKAILEIAALAIERKSTPERLLELLQGPRLPWAIALEGARSDAPGLGLIQGESFPYGRVWAIGHDVLARYLVNGVWNDRLLCERIGIRLFEDSVALRLDLISKITQRSSAGDEFARPFMIALATTVLKLDEQNGNAEFFKHWRKVLEILEGVPSNVRRSSRAFNHHLAISRRRVTQGDLFLLDATEKKGLLLRAAEDIEFSLDGIEPTKDDESALNLLNTLALVYQDLADIARQEGEASELARLLEKADEITNRALKENPNNSYVLETAAKNQLRQGLNAENRAERIEAAARALSFVFQASRLDTAATRRMKLGDLAGRALKVLRENDAGKEIDRLCDLGSAYGFIAKAWAGLPLSESDEASLVLEAINPESAASALKVLEQSPGRNWLLVRLMYDLVVIASPEAYLSQLRLLDELDATRGYQLSLQQNLERAVLLFIAGQHKQAVEEYNWLRPKVKESQAVVFVPTRLRWLPSPDKTSRAVCSAKVVDSSSTARSMAQVRELGGALAPFSPQEFGKSRMGPGEQFKCHVTFAAMGPFLKPIEGGNR